MLRHSEIYITNVRSAANRMWDTLDELLKYQREADAGNYGVTLPNGATGGNNEGILAADVLAVVYATANAVKGVMDAGNATNISKIL